jgi:hypothetical protein
LPTITTFALAQREINFKLEALRAGEQRQGKSYIQSEELDCLDEWIYQRIKLQNKRET